jgi:cytochrome c oxidase cbb3-type subunit III
MKYRMSGLFIGVISLGVAAACSSQASSNEASARPEKAPSSVAVSPAVLEQGRALYKANCVGCHGETGKGDGPGAGVFKPPPRDHTDKAYMSTLTDKQLADVIKMGGAIKGKPLMPSHPQLKEQELAALVAYVRSLAK